MARNRVFHVVIAYEDFVRAMRARQLSERLAAQVKPGITGIEITSKVWKFDFLRYAEFREEAARDIAGADMIIFSAWSGRLPFHVRTWIESWQPQKRSDPAALVALLEQEEEIPGERPSVPAYLRQIARKAGVDFFLKAGGWQQEGIPFDVDPLLHQPEHDSAVMEEVSHDDHPALREWGINE
jgi:hypothetical protein